MSNFLQLLRYSSIGLKKSKLSPSLIYYHQVRNHGYEGDGKTTMTSLTKEEKDILFIKSYNYFGFRLSNGLFVTGPVAIFAKQIFQWDVGGVFDINEDSVSLFYLLEPKIDLLLIGYGEEGLKVNKKVGLFLKQRNIITEVQPTKHAISTYNYLVAEGRNVAAALIPPLSYEISIQDTFSTLIDRNTYLKIDDMDYNEFQEKENELKYLEIEADYQSGKISKEKYDKEMKILRKKTHLFDQ